MSNIEQQIINYLSNEIDFVKASVLAKKLNVSNKTIYRSIQNINKGQYLIDSKRGLGFRLNAEVNPIYINNNDKKLQMYSLVIFILFKYPHSVKVFDVMSKFFISDFVISKQIEVINQLISAFNLKISRKKHDLTLKGNEIDVRKCLNYFLLRKAAITNVFTNIKQIFPSISERDKTFIYTQIELIQEELKVEIYEPYNINIFSHLYIMMKRYENYEKVKSVNLDKNYFENKKFYDVASLIIQNIANYINIQIESQEIVLLTEYLRSLRYINNSMDTDYLIDKDSKFFVDFIINNYQFTRAVDKKTLFYELYNHVKPMINRIKYKVTIVNPMLDEIEQTYHKEFIQIKKIINKMDNGFMKNISDDEISFLTIYIVKAMENTVSQKSVYIMCSSGIGTSELIKVKLINEIPNLKVKGTISSFDYVKNKEKFNDADLIISTIAVPNKDNKVLVVSPMLNGLDIKKIRYFLNDQS